MYLYLLSISYISYLERNSIYISCFGLKLYFIDFSFRIPLLQKRNIKNLGSAKRVKILFSFLRAFHPSPCSPAAFRGTKKPKRKKTYQLAPLARQSCPTCVDPDGKNYWELVHISIYVIITYIVIPIYIFLSFFFFFERGSGKGQRKNERENLKQFPCPPLAQCQAPNHDLSQNLEGDT